nr:hypothetical protein [Tanacetum cinerariifolium]
MSVLNTLMETCATLSQKVSHLEQDKLAQALEIIKLKKRVQKLEKKRRSKSLGLKRLRKGRKDDDNDSIKEASAVKPTVFDDEEVTMIMAQTLIKMKAKKARLFDEKNMIVYLKNIDGYKMEHFKCMTYDKESFKKLNVVEVLGSHSTQDTPTDDPKEISKEGVKNMLEIVPVSEFKVEALQVKYPLIDWEIYSKGSRSY